MNCLVKAAIAAGFAMFSATTAECCCRQYYTPWQCSSDHTYSYCCYMYRPDPTSPHFEMQYCVASPKFPACCFYYNPKVGKYWGVWFRDSDSQHCFFDFSGNPFPDEKELDGYKQKAIGMPEIPGSTDHLAMQMPPGTLR
jgi:hypothetical protein